MKDYVEVFKMFEEIANLKKQNDELLEALEGVLRFVQPRGEPYLSRYEAIQGAIKAVEKARGET